MTEHSNKKKWLAIAVVIMLVSLVGIMTSRLLRQPATLQNRAEFQGRDVDCTWTSGAVGLTTFTVQLLDALNNVVTQQDVTIDVQSSAQELTHTFTGASIDIPVDGTADVYCNVIPIDVGGQSCTNPIPQTKSQPGICNYSAPPVPTDTPVPTGSTTPTPTGTLTPTVTPTVTPTSTLTPTVTPTITVTPPACPAPTGLNVQIICANCTAP